MLAAERWHAGNFLTQMLLGKLMAQDKPAHSVHEVLPLPSPPPSFLLQILNSTISAVDVILGTIKHLFEFNGPIFGANAFSFENSTTFSDSAVTDRNRRGKVHGWLPVLLLAPITQAGEKTRGVGQAGLGLPC